MLKPCGNTLPQQNRQSESPPAWQGGQHVAAKLLVGFAQRGVARADQNRFFSCRVKGRTMLRGWTFRPKRPSIRRASSSTFKDESSDRNCPRKSITSASSL